MSLKTAGLLGVIGRRPEASDMILTTKVG